VIEAGAVFAGELPVVPEAGEDAILMMVIADWAAEMTADIAEGFDLALVFVKKDVVIADPACELAGYLQFRDGR
jgi:hypothetical protein